MPRRTVLAWAGLSALAAPACLSPTIPLPPPEVPDTRQVGEGTFRLRGSLPFVAHVIVLNKRTQVSAGRNQVLHYDFEVLAEPTDTMVIWYETEVEISSAVEFIMNRTNPIVEDGGT